MLSVSELTQCVVIHHRSPSTVVGVVRGALASGVDADRIVVVDNSPPSDPTPAFPTGVRVLRTDNRGYAAAANDGIQYLQRLDGARPHTLVASHEAEITPPAIRELTDALADDSRIAAAGPTLFVTGTDEVWSTGGKFSKVLHVAGHHRNSTGAMTRTVDRDWLDGALVLYRSALVDEFRFDESYFLYFEETDLHVRLVRAGYRVVWVPTAVSHQTSSGIPPRLLGRNTLLFQDRHFRRATGRMAVLVAALRALAKKLLSGRGQWSDAQKILSGMRDAERRLRTETS